MVIVEERDTGTNLVGHEVVRAGNVTEPEAAVLSDVFEPAGSGSRLDLSVSRIGFPSAGRVQESKKKPTQNPEPQIRKKIPVSLSTGMRARD
jgi:hypothetical protein